MTGTEAALSVALRITHAADGLRARGADPQRALRTALSLGDAPPELEAMARAIWAIVVDGRAAGLDTLPRVLACADTLCSLGVAPCDAIGLVQWVDVPDDLKAIAQTAWAVSVESGSVARVQWSLATPCEGSGPGGATVADVLSRLLVLGDVLCSIGVEPRRVLDVLGSVALPPHVSAVVRSAWVFAAALDDDHESRGIGPNTRYPRWDGQREAQAPTAPSVVVASAAAAPSRDHAFDRQRCS